MTRILLLALLLLFSVPTRADTTVAKTLIDDFPYPQSFRVYVDKGETYFECHDEYGDGGTMPIDPDRFIATLQKIVEWMELNQSVKPNVKKELEYTDYVPKRGFGQISFHGNEDGSSFAILIVGLNACTIDKDHINILAWGTKKNLDNARIEDAENKADLFH